MTPHRFITSQSPSLVLRENLHKVGKINKGNRRAKRLWQNAVPAPDEPAAEGFPFVWRPSASSCALRVLFDFFFYRNFPSFSSPYQGASAARRPFECVFATP